MTRVPTSVMSPFSFPSRVAWCRFPFSGSRVIWRATKSPSTSPFVSVTSFFSATLVVTVAMSGHVGASLTPFTVTVTPCL